MKIKNSCSLSDGHSIDCLREQLKKSQRTCAELRTDNLRKDVTIQKLATDLQALQSSNAEHLIADGEENVIPRKRAKAIERNRIEYENRVGTTYRTELSNTGCDEIDV